MSFKRAKVEGRSTRLRPKFMKWPHETPSASIMSNAGFVYKPRLSAADNVRCNNCGQEFRNWGNVNIISFKHDSTKCAPQLTKRKSPASTITAPKAATPKIRQFLNQEVEPEGNESIKQNSKTASEQTRNKEQSFAVANSSREVQRGLAGLDISATPSRSSKYKPAMKPAEMKTELLANVDQCPTFHAVSAPQTRVSSCATTSARRCALERVFGTNASDKDVGHFETGTPCRITASPPVSPTKTASGAEGHVWHPTNRDAVVNDEDDEQINEIVGDIKDSTMAIFDRLEVHAGKMSTTSLLVVVESILSSHYQQLEMASVFVLECNFCYRNLYR